jgi:hypothetical protein
LNEERHSLDEVSWSETGQKKAAISTAAAAAARWMKKSHIE